MVPGERDGFAAGVGVLILTLRPGDDQEERRLALVKAFLEQEGRQVLPASLCRMHRLVEPLGVPFPKMTTRWAVARWGSCAHREGRISINKALVCVPPSCVDYVMLHELVHFLHPDHSPAFHARMAALLPDCRGAGGRPPPGFRPGSRLNNRRECGILKNTGSAVVDLPSCGSINNR